MHVGSRRISSTLSSRFVGNDPNRKTPYLGNAARTSHCGPNQKHYHGPDRRPDETRTLIGSVPAKRLSQVGGNERADDAQNCREDEALRLIASRGDELGKGPPQ